MEWSIQQIARLAGTTSRTLRHYDEFGLLPPSRIGSNGYRYYDDRALVRLQRVLLLRDLGLGLPQIAEVINREADEASALETHLSLLQLEKERLSKQIAAVKHTIAALKGGEELMAEEVLDGFDHSKFKDEVEQRWGKEAYAKSDSWWRSMSETERSKWMANASDLQAAWRAAAESGLAPDSEEAATLASRHIEWLRGVPGTPAADPTGDLRGYVAGLAEMYVADDRFAANYGGIKGAEFVRDALLAFLANSPA